MLPLAMAVVPRKRELLNCQNEKNLCSFHTTWTVFQKDLDVWNWSWWVPNLFMCQMFKYTKKCSIIDKKLSQFRFSKHHSCNHSKYFVSRVVLTNQIKAPILIVLWMQSFILIDKQSMLRFYISEGVHECVRDFI